VNADTFKIHADIVAKNFHASFMGIAQGCGIGRIDFSGWPETLCIFPLYEKEDHSSFPLFDEQGKFVHMLFAPDCDSIGKGGKAIEDLRAVFHFHKAFFFL
jgi:hypothetical protein